MGVDRGELTQQKVVYAYPCRVNLVHNVRGLYALAGFVRCFTLPSSYVTAALADPAARPVRPVARKAPATAVAVLARQPRVFIGDMVSPICAVSLRCLELRAASRSSR